MQLKLFGVDFDDVLIPFDRCWQEYHLHTYGTPAESQQFTEEMWERANKFIHSPHHDLIPAMEHALPVLQVLRAKRQLVIVTSRDNSLAAPTHRLMHSRFPGIFTASYFLHSGKQNILGTKGDVCKKFGIRDFIDDSVEHATKAMDAGARSFLFTTEKNKGAEVPGLHRIHSWEDLLEFEW